MDIAEIRKKDPHGLQRCGPGVYAIYLVAKRSAPILRLRGIAPDEVVENLRLLAPNGPFDRKGHARILYKLINPYGHGANSQRFQNATLHWFRTRHGEDAMLTDGFALFICASIWWMDQTGLRSVRPGLPSLTTSDFDKKLQSLGFLKKERDALCRVLRYRPTKRKAK